MEAVDETSGPPTQDFTAENGAQYVQNNYGYPPPSGAFAIDQSLQMPEGVEDYTTSQTKNAGQRRDNGTSSLPEQNGNDDIINSRVNSANNSTLPPASASAQTPLNSSTKRKSPDDSQDVPNLGEPQSGRKRSKVSRACDQCRRKKVKCDSVIDNAGIPSTCSPCLKAGQTCDYSRVPQKRGPSKGYIKELSERVQQVEGQLALQSQGYRASLDGSTAPFPDQPFSPDEETARRQSSYSQHSPFAEIRRENRFPSIGGWQLNNTNTSYPRERGSIAIPPDQRHPDHNLPLQPLSIPEKITKPFWAEYSDLATKRRKVPVDPASFTDDDKMSLSQYYNVIHPFCQILPDDRESPCAVFRRADPEYQNAFLAALNILPQESRSTTGNASNTKNLYFETLTDLENFVKSEVVKQINPAADDNNLLLLWVQIFLVILAMHNLDTYTNTNLPTANLVRMPILFCFEIERTEQVNDEKSLPPDFVDAKYTATMLARLHAMSVGVVHDPQLFPPSFWPDQEQHQDASVRNAIYITLPTIQYAIGLSAKGATISDLYMQMTDQTIQIGALKGANLDPTHPLLEELRAFHGLLLMRSQYNWLTGRQCMEPCMRLIEAIASSATDSGPEIGVYGYRYNPLSFHTYTMATLTTLELLQCNHQDPNMVLCVNEAVEKIRGLLGQLVEKREVASGGAGGRFWANVLLDLVQERTAGAGAAAGGGEEGRKEVEEVCVDLALLMRQGYATVLLNVAARK